MTAQHSFAMPIAAPSTTAGGRSVVIASIGNILEWYDFTVYGFLAAHISRIFFPNADQTIALLATFGAFGVGFLARPLGAVVFGRMADVRGRRFVLLLAMCMMAGASILIGILPGYAAFGIAAPALVVLARLTQGLSAGAEFGGAAAYLIEWAPEGKRGFYSSFHQVGTYGGLLLGVATVASISSLLSPDQMSDWGWRVPFIAGGFLGIYAIFMRRTIEETPKFEKLDTGSSVARDAARSPIVATLQSIGIVAVWTVTSFAVLVYMTTFTQRLGGLTPQESLWSTSISAAVAVGLIPVFGALSDRLGRKIIFGAGALAFILLPVPLYGVIVAKPGFGTIVLIQVALSIFTGMIAGVGPAIISELFSTRQRATLVGISSAVSVTVFGGFAPFISTFLVERMQSPIAPAYYAVVIAIFTFVTILTIRETAHRELK